MAMGAATGGAVMVTWLAAAEVLHLWACERRFGFCVSGTGDRKFGHFKVCRLAVLLSAVMRMFGPVSPCARVAFVKMLCNLVPFLVSFLQAG